MKSLLAAGLGLSLSMFSACSFTQRGEPELLNETMLLTDAQETQLGTQLHQALVQQGVRFSKDPAAIRYLEGVMWKLRPAVLRDRETNWRLHLIDDPKTVNAFATPGGHLYVFSGLLLAAESDAEVASVLAHEVGHTVGRHTTRQMVDGYGLQTMTATAAGEHPGLAAQLAVAVLQQGSLLVHSEPDEREADLYAMRYAAAAGYDPRGIALFFRRLPVRDGALTEPAAWLASHPVTEDRLEHITTVISRERLEGSFGNTEQLGRLKSQLVSRAPVSMR